ncbi:MAG: alcohol dehydrogenase catalytic domain-containing protein [Caldilineaceae bacterium]
MATNLERYRSASAALPEWNRLWPLYGAGFENLGVNGQPLDVPLVRPGPGELLVRHDAASICVSDVKVIRAGEQHHYVLHNMRERPVVLGHEVTLTIVEVGTDLQGTYRPGDRFVVQPAIYIGGKPRGYRFELHGGFSRYSIVDRRVLAGDEGNYLVPLHRDDGYAEVALCEPWACVEASYAVTYRTTWKPGGVVLLAGDSAGIELGLAATWRPRIVVLAVRDAAFAAQVRAWALQAGVAVQEGDDGQVRYDDVVVLGNEPRCEEFFARLAVGGIFNIVLCGGRAQPIAVEARRLHYDRLLVTGTGGSDLSAAYTPVRTQLRAGGAAWILGAAGPMGQMHLLRALSLPGRPRKVVATNLHAGRMELVRRQHQQLAAANGVALACLSADQFADEAALAAQLREEGGGGYDDIVIVAPAVEALEQAMAAAGENCVINMFAGTAPGAYAHIDLNAVALRGVRFTGISGSSIADLRRVRDLVESRQLDTNRSVAAIGGIEGVVDGLHAVAGGRFGGKVVIFPNLNKPLPLTPLSELRAVLPTVAAQLGEGGSWTRAAEEELLNVML